MNRWSRATQEEQIRQLAEAKAADTAKCVLDAEAFAMVRESALKLYGWQWPEGVGFHEGSVLLLNHLVERWANAP